MKVSVVIPVYNEEKTVRGVLEKVKAVDIDKQIIVVNDGSTDGTSEILEVERQEGSIEVLHLPKNMGKGAALRAGFQHVRGDIVIVQDADSEYDPADYYALIRPIIQGRAAVVYGSRFINKGERGPFLTLWANRFLTWVTNRLYGAHLTDMETCYKVFKSDILKELNLRAARFNIEPEITVQILRNGYDIHEVPVSYRPRSRKEGKKINWRDGIMALYTLFKHKFWT